MAHPQKIHFHIQWYLRNELGQNLYDSTARRILFSMCRTRAEISSAGTIWAETSTPIPIGSPSVTRAITLNATQPSILNNSQK